LDIQSILKEKKVLVERALEEFLPAAGYAPELRAAMRYSVFAGGKRFRPILALLSFEACGGSNRDWVLPFACGIEFIHTYSLIHDDLPCMDNDDLRRGKPTAHQVFGEATAILAGDALFALAFELFTRGAAPVERKFQVIEDMVRTTGPNGIVGGQMTDISANKFFQPKPLRQLHFHKTAIFIAAALDAGAILAGAPAERLALIQRAGICLGMMFQITDDILDLTAPKELLGKTTKKDMALDKLTYPKIYGIAGSQFRAREYARHAQSLFSRLGNEFKPFSAIADFLLARGF
jgi:geranylgeranyl diphosphate synthase type II